MPEALALCAAVVFGQPGGAVLVGCGSVLLPSEDVTLVALAWGALSGLGTGVGVAFLYRA